MPDMHCGFVRLLLLSTRFFSHYLHRKCTRPTPPPLLLAHVRLPRPWAKMGGVSSRTDRLLLRYMRAKTTQNARNNYKNKWCGAFLTLAAEPYGGRFNKSWTVITLWHITGLASAGFIAWMLDVEGSERWHCQNYLRIKVLTSMSAYT